MRVITLLLMTVCLCCAGINPLRKKVKEQERSLLDQYITSASDRPESTGETTPGAVWSSTARLTDLGRDMRASQVDDVVTVIVSETVNAVATGASTSARSSSAKASLNSLAGKKSAAGALVNLADLGGEQKLNGTGTTTRAATLNATLTARVIKVLPGGLLLLEGDKRIQVNSEQQLVMVRGIIRTADVSTSNTVASTQIADLEVRVNGKGIVGDAVRRPNILYRLLLGVLPF